MTTFGIMSILAPTLVALVVGVVVWIENDQMRREQLRTARATPSSGGSSGSSDGQARAAPLPVGNVGATRQADGTQPTSPIALHPAVDEGIKPGSGHFTGGTLVCKCEDQPVEIAIKGDVMHNHLCGCTKCWKPTGAIFSMIALVPHENLSVIESGVKLEIVDPSATMQRHACKGCGTHMFARAENKRHPFYGSDFIHPELFREAGWAAPRFAAFVSSVIADGVKPELMPRIRSRLKELGLEPYDILSPELMDTIRAHISTDDLQKRA
jgi:S-(hydroxymethyl)glutathione synthase